MNKRTLTIISFLLFTLVNPPNCQAQNTAEMDTLMLKPAPDQKDTGSQFEVIKKYPWIQARNVPDSVIRKIKESDVYWYADKTPERMKEKRPATRRSFSLFDQRWFGILIWIILIAGIISIAVWFLATGNISLFRRRAVHMDGINEVIEADENIFNLDYAKQVRNALSEKNYRLAVRLLYLSSLKDMADNNIINYKQGKTNRQYLSEINNTSYYTNFLSLTRTFEYVWYGKFNLSESEFAMIENNFKAFKKNIQ